MMLRKPFGLVLIMAVFICLASCVPVSQPGLGMTLTETPITDAELKAVQQQIMRAAEAAGISVTSSISVAEKRVEVQVGNPELFRQEMRAAGLDLPEWVKVTAIDPDKLTDTLRGKVETYTGPDGSTIYFPKQGPTNVHMEALLQGTLILDENGCLRMQVEGETTLLLPWPYDTTLQISGKTIEIIDGSGQVVGRVGTPSRMGGGNVPSVNVPGFPTQACPGPIWVVGDIETLAAQAVPDIYVQPLPISGVFLQQSLPAPNEASLNGVLVLDETGCLRVDGHAVLWPPDVWPREGPGPLHFVRVEGGNEITVAVLGKDVSLSGAKREPGDYRYFENKVPCAGPYWGTAAINER